MEMSNVLASLEALCADPRAWAIVALAAGKALYSLVCFLRCPVLNARSVIDAQAAREATNARHVHNPRFLALMLTGIVLSLAGLYLLPSPALGPAALAAMALGAFLMLVGPSRLTIDDTTLRVVAARAEGGEALAFAMDRLRSAHVERLTLEFGFAALLALLVAAY